MDNSRKHTKPAPTISEALLMDSITLCTTDDDEYVEASHTRIAGCKIKREPRAPSPSTSSDDDLPAPPIDLDIQVKALSVQVKALVEKGKKRQAHRFLKEMLRLNTEAVQAKVLAQYKKELREKARKAKAEEKANKYKKKAPVGEVFHSNTCVMSIVPNCVCNQKSATLRVDAESPAASRPMHIVNPPTSGPVVVANHQLEQLSDSKRVMSPRNKLANFTRVMKFDTLGVDSEEMLPTIQKVDEDDRYMFTADINEDMDLGAIQINEDVDLNSILDSGEDTNKNSVAIESIVTNHERNKSAGLLKSYTNSNLRQTDNLLNITLQPRRPILGKREEIKRDFLEELSSGAADGKTVSIHLTRDLETHSDHLMASTTKKRMLTTDVEEYVRDFVKKGDEVAKKMETAWKTPRAKFRGNTEEQSSNPQRSNDNKERAISHGRPHRSKEADKRYPRSSDAGRRVEDQAERRTTRSKDAKGRRTRYDRYEQTEGRTIRSRKAEVRTTRSSTTKIHAKETTTEHSNRTKQHNKPATRSGEERTGRPVADNHTARSGEARVAQAATAGDGKCAARAAKRTTRSREANNRGLLALTGIGECTSRPDKRTARSGAIGEDKFARSVSREEKFPDARISRSAATVDTHIPQASRSRHKSADSKETKKRNFLDEARVVQYRPPEAPPSKGDEKGSVSFTVGYMTRSSAQVKIARDRLPQFACLDAGQTIKDPNYEREEKSTLRLNNIGNIGSGKERMAAVELATNRSPRAEIKECHAQTFKRPQTPTSHSKDGEKYQTKAPATRSTAQVQKPRVILQLLPTKKDPNYGKLHSQIEARTTPKLPEAHTECTTRFRKCHAQTPTKWILLKQPEPATENAARFREPRMTRASTRVQISRDRVPQFAQAVTKGTRIQDAGNTLSAVGSGSNNRAVIPNKILTRKILLATSTKANIPQPPKSRVMTPAQNLKTRQMVWPYPNPRAYKHSVVNILQLRPNNQVNQLKSQELSSACQILYIQKGVQSVTTVSHLGMAPDHPKEHPTTKIQPASAPRCRISLDDYRQRVIFGQIPNNHVQFKRIQPNLIIRPVGVSQNPLRYFPQRPNYPPIATSNWYNNILTLRPNFQSSPPVLPTRIIVITKRDSLGLGQYNRCTPIQTLADILNPGAMTQQRLEAHLGQTRQLCLPQARQIELAHHLGRTRQENLQLSTPTRTLEANTNITDRVMAVNAEEARAIVPTRLAHYKIEGPMQKRIIPCLELKMEKDYSYQTRFDQITKWLADSHPRDKSAEIKHEPFRQPNPSGTRISLQSVKKSTKPMEVSEELTKSPLKVVRGFFSISVSLPSRQNSSSATSKNVVSAVSTHETEKEDPNMKVVVDMTEPCMQHSRVSKCLTNLSVDTKSVTPPKEPGFETEKCKKLESSENDFVSSTTNPESTTPPEATYKLKPAKFSEDDYVLVSPNSKIVNPKPPQSPKSSEDRSKTAEVSEDDCEFVAEVVLTSVISALRAEKHMCPPEGCAPLEVSSKRHRINSQSTEEEDNGGSEKIGMPRFVNDNNSSTSRGEVSESKKLTVESITKKRKCGLDIDSMSKKKSKQDHSAASKARKRKKSSKMNDIKPSGKRIRTMLNRYEDDHEYSSSAATRKMVPIRSEICASPISSKDDEDFIAKSRDDCSSKKGNDASILTRSTSSRIDKMRKRKTDEDSSMPPRNDDKVHRRKIVPKRTDGDASYTPRNDDEAHKGKINVLHRKTNDGPHSAQKSKTDEEPPSISNPNPPSNCHYRRYKDEAGPSQKAGNGRHELEQSRTNSQEKLLKPPYCRHNTRPERSATSKQLKGFDANHGGFRGTFGEGEHNWNRFKNARDFRMHLGMPTVSPTYRIPRYGKKSAQ